MNTLLRWLEDRTGLASACRGCLERPVPAGRCCLGVWPSVILFVFVVEAITGLVLWMYYSPSAQSAWESVYYVQHEVLGGAVLRGIHYHAGQVLLAALALYVLHAIFARAYRAPREVEFLLAVLLVLVTLGLLLTGDLLSWSQRGYWSTNVRTNFLLLIPGIGSALRKLAIGGPEMGHLTLTRFFALHAGLFSAALAALLWLHARAVWRADQIEAAGSGASPYWPGQSLRNASACAVALVVIAVLVATGTELGSPRDPIDAYAAARPDWYFIGVYQFANYFPGGLKIVPIFLVPGAIVLVFLAMPWVGRSRVGHVANVVIAAGLLIAAVVLSAISLAHDRANPSHQESLQAEHASAERVLELVKAKGIPTAGALALLWDDSKTQGPKLFKQHCASCHDYNGGERPMLAEKPSAPDLYDFASVQWLTGFLDLKQLAFNPPPEELSPSNRPKYFGNTKFQKGKMATFLKDDLPSLKKDIDDGPAQFRKLIEALAAESERASSTKPSEDTLALFEDFTCTSSGCHHFHGNGEKGAAPDLTGYGSREWLIGIISDPAHKRFYGAKNDRMPSYAPAGRPDQQVLTPRQVEMLAEWLRRQWYEPSATPAE
ncbi:MAG: cytochrome b N-terminal domain-containing protein [Thermoguttaceae bacterium]|nr:cytochrome b N-terminal domain-containing protein [Thermoguttaceae bacterium]